MMSILELEGQMEVIGAWLMCRTLALLRSGVIDAEIFDSSVFTVTIPLAT